MDLAGRTKTTTGYDSIWRPTSAKWRHKPAHATVHVGLRSNNRPSFLRLDSVDEISSGGLQSTTSNMTPRISLSEPSNANTMGYGMNLLTSFCAAIVNIPNLGGKKNLTDNSLQKFRFFSGKKEDYIPCETDEKHLTMGDFCFTGDRYDSRTEDMNRLQSTVNSLNSASGFMAFAPKWYTGQSSGWNGFRVGNQHGPGNKNLWQQPCSSLYANKMYPEYCGGQFNGAMHPFTDFMGSNNNLTTNMAHLSLNQNKSSRKCLERTEKRKQDLANSFKDLFISSICRDQQANQNMLEGENVSCQQNEISANTPKNPGKGSVKPAVAVSMQSNNSAQFCVRTPHRCLKRALSHPLPTCRPTVIDELANKTACVTKRLEHDEEKLLQVLPGDSSKQKTKLINDKSSYSNRSSPGSSSRDSNICDSVDVHCSGNLGQFSFTVNNHGTSDTTSGFHGVPMDSSADFSAAGISIEDGQRKPKSCKRPRPSSKKRRRLKARQQRCSVSNEHIEPSITMQTNKKCKLETLDNIHSKRIVQCRKNSKLNLDKPTGNSSYNPVSFILGINPLENGQTGAYKAYSVSVLVDGDESEFSEFEDDGCDGGDFSSLQDFFPQSGLNPLNFKVSISISPSAECGLVSPGLGTSHGLEAINMSWVNICDTKSSKPKPKSSKKVQFAPDDTLATVHPMVTWSYAYQVARKGPWEEYARDRERFSRRLRETECVLSPVLQQDHRKLVYERNCSNQ